MITLAEALRLCNKTKNPDGKGVYLRHSDDSPRISTHWISVKKLTEKLDLKKIHVTTIEPLFSYADFDGMVFTVPELSWEDIYRLTHST